eukprot:2784303-Amphidinium_carterae.1
MEVLQRADFFKACSRTASTCILNGVDGLCGHTLWTWNPHYSLTKKDYINIKNAQYSSHEQFSSGCETLSVAVLTGWAGKAMCGCCGEVLCELSAWRVGTKPAGGCQVCVPRGRVDVAGFDRDDSGYIAIEELDAAATLVIARCKSAPRNRKAPKRRPRIEAQGS